MSTRPLSVQVCSSIQSKPATMAGFALKTDYYTKSTPTMANYRKPRLVKAARGWYIEYYYRVPEDASWYYNKEWVRIQVREDINRRKGDDRETYAAWLLDYITQSLKVGFNPLILEKEAGEQLTMPDHKREWNATDAMQSFIAAWKQKKDDKDIEPTTFAKYERVVNRFIDWLGVMKIPYINIQLITKDHVQRFLKDNRAKYGYSLRENNNTLDFLRTAFLYLVEEKIIPDNPMSGIKKQKTPSKKHRYYDSVTLKKIKDAVLLSDPYLWFACEIVYYLCIRSEKELKNFKVGNILWEQDRILLTQTKGGSEQFVPMDHHIKKLFKERGIDKFPPNYYVLGIKGEPAAQPFGKGFFSKRFKKFRDQVGVDANFTIYGFKHSRTIDLKQAGLDDATIMSLTRHSTFSAYSVYMRDLGLQADAGSINAVSRKI